MTRMAKRMMTDVNDTSSSTMPEFFAGTGDGFVGTKNHGWSASAITLFGRSAAGVEPTAAGYSTWRICPQMGNFSSLAVSIPAQIGEIRVEISADVSKTEVDIAFPGWALSVYVPIREGFNVTDTSGLTERGEVVVNGQIYILLTTDKAGTYHVQAS